MRPAADARPLGKEADLFPYPAPTFWLYLWNSVKSDQKEGDSKDKKDEEEDMSLD